jgi:hypothetical protein
MSYNFIPIMLGVSNRTAKKAKWLGGKLKKMNLTKVYWGFFQSFNRGLIGLLGVYYGGIKF